MDDSISYDVEPRLGATEFIDVLRRSTLAERRPVEHADTIAAMLTNADVIVTAREGALLVGVSRAITDFSYCTYLSDLAVDVAFQRHGIGRELIRRTHVAAGLGTTLILLAAPKARSYYPHIGMRRHESCWLLQRHDRPPAADLESWSGPADDALQMMPRDTSPPQQAAAIAFRRVGQSVQICLIRRKDSDVWGIPKGFVDPGETHEATALNETWEEAGLRGRLTGGSIGSYEYEKWGSTFTVAVYLLEVLDQRDRWQEAGFRERRWTSFDEAALLLSRHPVRPLLDRAAGALAVSPDRPLEASSGTDTSS